MQDLKLAVLIDADNISPKYVKVILDEAASFGVAYGKSTRTPLTSTPSSS